MIIGNSFIQTSTTDERDPDPEPTLAFDATLSTDFVDATHLRFAEGDPAAMFQAVRVIGQLKAEVLEYRPEGKS